MEGPFDADPLRLHVGRVEALRDGLVDVDATGLGNELQHGVMRRVRLHPALLTLLWARRSKRHEPADVESRRYFSRP